MHSLIITVTLCHSLIICVQTCIIFFCNFAKSCIKIMELKLSWKYIVQTNTNVLRVWKCILLVCLGCSSDYRRWQWTYVCDHVCVLIGWLVKPLFIVSILKWHKLVTMCQWWCVDWSNPSLINIWPLGWATISTWPLFWLTTTVWSWLGSRIS